MAGWGLIPQLRVEDVASAVAFYGEVLGFSVEGGGNDHFSVTRGEARIMIERPSGHLGPDYNAAIATRIGARSPVSFSIEEPDVNAYHDRLVRAGVTVVDPIAQRPWGQTAFTVEDPDGHWLTFWQRTSATPPAT